MDKEFKTEIEMPMRNRIIVTPKSKPELRLSFDDMSWNCANHTVTLQFWETLDFATLSWLVSINEVREKLLRSAFGQVEKEIITLEFVNGLGRSLIVIVLTGLELLEHECIANMKYAHPLNHKMIIKYEKVEILHDCKKNRLNNN